MTVKFIYLMAEVDIMAMINEVTGPKVWVVDNPGSKKYHMTGGYGQPDMKQCFCGAKIKATKVIDPRDIAAREGFQDLNLWCIKCIGLLDFEALDQKIVFAAIDFGNGYFYKDNLMQHLSRRKPKLRLTPPPAIPDTATITSVASSVPIVSTRRRSTGGAVQIAPPIKKRKTRSDKGVKRGPRKKEVVEDVEISLGDDTESETNNGME